MPKNKKEYSSNDSDEDNTLPAAKKSKESLSKKSKNGETPKQWELEKLRQVRINEFRGRKLIDIREYYEKDGEYLPGKKGISLSVSQWKKLLDVADEISHAIEQE